jgi:hypothetical protein
MKTLFWVFSFLLCASLIIFLLPPKHQLPWRRRLRRPRGQNYPWHSKATHTRRPLFHFSATYPESTLFKMLAVARTRGSPGGERHGQNRDLHHESRDLHHVRCTWRSVPQPQRHHPAGAIAGYYTDAGFLVHSFLRTPDGTVTTFDPPGATCSLSTQNICSGASPITPAGVILGTYADANRFHGFLRATDGTFTTFDPPDSIETFASTINPAGAITGIYIGGA